MGHPVLLIAVSLLLTWVQVMSDNSPDCPLIYQRFSTSHTYCQPKKPTCNRLRSNLAQEEVNQALQLHNAYRSVIATQQKESNGLPPAADMIMMEWDNELAAIAQRHADQCVYAHDEDNQRRVRNFGVGQNIAQQTSSDRRKPDWPSAIRAFFEEIKYFHSDLICGPRALDQIGHFTQLVWSRSFRVGCGYTMYKEGNKYYRLYVCNYGPKGNDDASCVYNPGPACSKCPINTQCTTGSQFPGLCKRINDEEPYQPIKAPHFFDCNFRNPSSPDCQINVMGGDSWYIVPALGGNYLETVLQPGQNGSIIFSRQLTPSPGAKSMCAQVRYRKGSNLAKDRQNDEARAIFTIPSSDDFTTDFDLTPYGQDFTSYSMGLGWTSPTKMKISFAVPRGAAPQFFNLQSIVGWNDKCQKIEY